MTEPGGMSVYSVALTPLIGFGCLVTADHRGIQSLGFVMVMGLGVALFACYTVLPAILRLRTGRVTPALPLPGHDELHAAMDVEREPDPKPEPVTAEEKR